MTTFLYRLGTLTAKRHWLTLGAWVLVLAIVGGTYSLFGGSISSAITIPGTPTAQTADLLAKKFPSASGGSGSLVFETTTGQGFTAEQQRQIGTFLTRFKDYPQVRDVTNPFTTEKQLLDNKQTLADNKQKLTDGEKKLDDGQKQLDAGQKRLDAGQQQLKAQISQAKAAGTYVYAKPQLDAAQQEIDKQQDTIDKQQQKITDGRADIKTNTAKLALGERLLNLSSNFHLVTEDKTTAIGRVAFTKGINEVDPDIKARIVAAADDAKITGVNVYVTNDIAQAPVSVLGPGEVTGLIIAAIVLLLLLGTLLGAALPLVSAGLGVGVALLGALSFSSLVQFISVTPVLGVMLGLAVGIDYSLFIINRHRSQLKRGMALHESIGLANGTSGNAVVFAGSTVIVALLALNVTGIPFLGLMGTVGAVAVFVAIFVAVSFTPALLGMLGMRILRRRERAHLADKPTPPPTLRPMRTWRAAATLLVGVLALGALALPATGMRLGLPDGSTEATESTQYRAFHTIQEKFGAGQNGPLLAVAELPTKLTGDDLRAQEASIGELLAKQPHVKNLVPVGASKDGTVLAYQIIPTSGPTSQTTEDLVKGLRTLTPNVTGGQATIAIAGTASANIDVSEKLAGVLPLYLALVLGLSLIILILVFRSFLVPITATLGFVLSLLATFGALTAVYQNGFLDFIFGVHDPGPIISFLPIIEMGILFGLAMDYQLFLVSGMREAWAHGAPARLAVRQGVHNGRAVVTAAAIIMISVFAGFIFSDSAVIRPIGFGLGFGVLVDAFIVRLLLIPAVMHLLGNAAWWFPKWLDRLLPNMDVEGAKLERSHPFIELENIDREPAAAVPVEQNVCQSDSEPAQTEASIIEREIDEPDEIQPVELPDPLADLKRALGN